MHKNRWRYLKVTIAIAIMFLANTVYVAFVPMFLREVEATEDSSADKSSTFHATQSSNDFHSNFQDKNKRMPKSFQNFWGFAAFDKDSSFDGIKGCGDFAIADGDSIELVIGVNPEAYDSLVKAINASQGKIVNTVSIRGEVIAIVADVPLNAISLLVKDVQMSSLAQYIELNMKFQAQFVPDDPYWSLQWGPQKIKADWAWNTTIGNPSVLVAVIDTGVDWNHPDLSANYVALGYDWVNDDNNPMDDHGHGTHCAGIIGAVLNNGIGIAGLSQVSIMAEKALDMYGSGYEDDLANAIIHAVDQGAKILSNSWGGYGESLLIHDAVQYAYENGVLVVAAAGNDVTSSRLYPAAYDEVVAVTATDSNDYPAWFTNFGDWVEVAAPGVDIYSTVWDDSYTYMSGTSMSCPHVSGVATLIWSQFLNATRDWVRAQLRYTADDLGDPGFDEYYGYGRINARKAVEQAPPDHDLLIFDWEKPSFIQPGDLVSFDVTVLNFGANDEENVAVQLLVDGNLTDSTLIDHLMNGTLTTVSLSWNPLVERMYNVTLYVVPVPGETATENNVVTEMVSVRSVVGFVLWDDVHDADGDSLTGNYLLLYQLLSSNGFVVDELTSGTINSGVLASYNILVLVDPELDFLPSEITDIQDWVATGGALIVIPDGGYPPTINTLMDPYGVQVTGRYGGYGETTDIVSHPITQNVSAIYVDWVREISVTSPSTCLAWVTESGERYAFLSATDSGNVVVASDSNIMDNYGLEIASNTQLMLNTFNWMVIKYEHELTVRLDAPSYLEPGEASLLNATVYNRGLNNETGVELQLFINGTLVSNITIPELVNGTSYTMNYPWTTPSVEAVYNVTAYAPPVPEENVTLNNMITKFVHVQYPLINPVPGQYANYILNYYGPSGSLIGRGYFNLTYEYYVEPHKIYVTVWQRDPSGYIYMGWLIVNTMDRFVESGVWAGLWYPGWIETDINIGSTINLLSGTATVSGSRIIVVGARAIDCWEISYSEYEYQYTFWYDKASGLWISMEAIDPYGNRMELLLVDTNVPIGTQYEHDLGVTVDAPLYLQPSETSVLSATVYNLGLNNETNVEIHLLINGTEVASETLTELINGTSYTINYTWTPTAEGIYNITAYAPPVSGEDVIINNIASRMVRVFYIEIALISDHSELVAIAPILDSMGIGYDIYNDNWMYLYTENLSLLLNYKAVIFYTDSRWITSNEYSALESYLSLSGCLLVTGFDCLVSDARLASLVRSSSTGDNVGEYDLYVVDATHPIMYGPYGSFPAGYHIYGLSSDCDMAEADTARNAVTVAELADGYDKIIATEGLPGKVVFWNGVGTSDWTMSSDCQAMLKNMIHWFTVRYEHELVVFLQAPKFLEPGSSAMLNATVQNAGLNNETNVELQILINGTIVKSETILQLRNGTSQTISHLWTPTITGKYNITINAPPVPGENITRNNIYSRIIPVQYAPRILAYVQYTDYWQEYPNTLRAIESTFGPNYILTELWDYTQLDSMIGGKDILLIPEQEYADLYTMQTIGVAWSETLSQFLEDGGIIIVCDFNWGSGGTYGILTGAGLMSISWANYRTYYTLYVVDPSDPLAEGVSSPFTAPDGTISFATQEKNVVVDDGTYPVVIHKKIGRGHIALLGFDFFSSNANAERILGNAVALASYITIYISPSSGSLGTKVEVSGTKATANGTVLIYWDSILMGTTTANAIGDFTYLLIVPSDATVGIHTIMAVDSATGRTVMAPFRVLLITLDPSKGPPGTKVTVKGAGFTPGNQTTITFNDMLIGYASVNDFGNFTFTFNIPLSAAETQAIKAYDVEGYAIATYTVVDVTALDVQIDVGAMHFRGEIAEFFAQTAFRGQAINATIKSAVLYKPDGTAENVAAQLIATGLYKLSYTIPADASTGTYTLVVSASYTTGTVEAEGTSFKCFLISQTLTSMDLIIQEIQGDIVTIIIPNLGTIKANLTAIDATLLSLNGTTAWIQTNLGLARADIQAVNATLTSLNGTTAEIQTSIGTIQVSLEAIQLKVIAINGTTATIQTTLGIMNGTIAEIQGDIATIQTPLGQIQADISGLKGTQDAWIISHYVIVVLALIAAAGATFSLIMLRRRRS